MQAIASTIIALPGLAPQSVTLTRSAYGYVVTEFRNGQAIPTSYDGTNYQAALRAYSAVVDRMLGSDAT